MNAPITSAQLSSEVETFLAKATHPLLVVVGPTASGKTNLAISLSKQFDGEVVNADSRQIYQEMVIGNELTKPEEMQGIPHHLLSCVPLSETMSVADYKQEAERIIEDIQSRGKLPILCGGSVMWIDAVVDNFLIPEGEPDQELRQKLEEQSIDELLEELKRVDPESHGQLSEERNKRYIIRALEIFQLTGKPKSELAKKGNRKYEVFKIAPHREREDIYERINERTAYQLDNGMIPEVEYLVKKYADGKPRALLNLAWPGISSIGCKEVIPFLEGEIGKEELLSTLQQNNRNYAKRQLTWLRKDEEIRWVRG